MQVILGLFLIVATGCAFAQQHDIAPSARQLPPSESPGPDPACQTTACAASLPDAPSSVAQQAPTTAAAQPLSQSPRQILSLPPSSSGGVSSLIFVGGPHAQPAAITSESATSCWRDSSQKSDGSGWFNSLLNIGSRNQHYCALGEGGLWKRGTYAMSRAFAAHKYDGANSFNASGSFTPGTAPGFPVGFGTNSSYAYQYDAGQRMATRYATAIGRDTLKNMFREFWPDISTRVLKRRP